MTYLNPVAVIALVAVLAVAVFAIAMCVRIDDASTLTADDDRPSLPTLRSSPAPFDWQTLPELSE